MFSSCCDVTDVGVARLIETQVSLLRFNTQSIHFELVSNICATVLCIKQQLHAPVVKIV